jgi:hypothetical protein
MLNAILTSVQHTVLDLSAWWSSLNNTYRGGGCLLLALYLMWEATKASSSGKHDRMFFVTGMAALGLLAYGAALFVESNGGIR